MSLINEALKRAQEAQQQATRGADRDIELRPVEPGKAPERKDRWFLPSAVTAAVLLAAFCIYQALRPAGTREQVQARTIDQKQQAYSSTVTPISPTAPAVSERPLKAAPVAAPDVPALPGSKAHLESAIKSEHPNTNAVAISVPATEANNPTPTPATKTTLRLQGIVAHPTRPSAVINGKTVFVGDKLADKRVLAIDVETVTLAGSGETNVLTLP
jgi:hypothetical protein